MDEAEFQRQRDDADRALGRYFAEFSRLIFHMRAAMENVFARGDDLRPIQLVLGEMTAAPLATAFFALCKVLGDLSEDEEAIRERLHNEVIFKVIPERNDASHGDWWIGWRAQDAEAIEAPMLTRTKTKLAQGTAWTTHSVKELDERSDRLRELRDLTVEFGMICFGTHPLIRLGRDLDLRVSDVLNLAGPKGKRRVERGGPKAEAMPMHFP